MKRSEPKVNLTVTPTGKLLTEAIIAALRARLAQAKKAA